MRNLAPEKRLLKLLLQRALRLCAALILCLAHSFPEHAEAAPSAWPGSVQAVRGDWNDAAPPGEGWIDVDLPDDWRRRWPQFDGVVWYRLKWNAAAPVRDAGLFVDYLIFAGTIRVNGNELVRDASLTEPLSRMWNTPRYLRLPASLLRAGENEVLIRVSGLADYQPALGGVEVGAPEPMRAAWERAQRMRIDLQWLNLGIGTTLGCFFLALWLIRRRETAYGWYAAQQAAWFVFAVNFVSVTPWPFRITDTYAAMTSSAYVVYHACNAMFVLRFLDRRWPRAEAAMWAIVALAVAAMFLAPHRQVGAMREVLALVSMAMVAVTATVFLFLAWRGGSVPQRVLSLTALVSLVAMTHDILVFLNVIASNFYFVTYAETLSMIGIALALAWTFVANIRRIESFNTELRESVAASRAELAVTLERQHELELVHARLGERLNLAHDLHDGLGGMLIGNIAHLEAAAETVPTRTMLEVLRGLRDDLRLIIDTASSQTYGEDSLGQLVSLLRHRMTRLFEARRIAIRWHLEGIERLRLTSTQSMDILRILQEALANVLKHSGATGAEVDLVRADGRLRMEVRDDGIGLPAEQLRSGTGTRSMRARAQRLGARLDIAAAAGITSIRIEMPLPAQDA